MTLSSTSALKVKSRCSSCCCTDIQQRCKALAGLSAIFAILSVFGGIVFIGDPNRIVQNTMNAKAANLTRPLSPDEAKEFLSGPFQTGLLFLTNGFGTGFLCLIFFLGALVPDRTFLIIYVICKLLLIIGVTTGNIILMVSKYGSVAGSAGIAENVFDLFCVQAAFRYVKVLRKQANSITPQLNPIF